ncbi:MAG TPA: type II secretory pathway protein [Verrucomicrobiales bacterium]|nr:type II secretory pathway protein [Verrucomicrobiales bacterium]
MAAVTRDGIKITLVALAALAATSCASRRERPAGPIPDARPSAAEPATNGVAAAASPAPAQVEIPKVRFDAAHDEEIKKVFDLANSGRWEEAENQARSLVEQFPNDSALNRLYTWVSDSRQRVRDQAIEDKIRQIDSKNTPFNPTVKSILTEQKDRGLTPRKDLRDAVQQIESTPYVPNSYGRKIEHQGFLGSPSITEGPMAELLNRRISIHLDDVTLDQIIFELGDREKINFVADRSLPAFQKKLSVNFEQVQLREFLEYVSRNLEISFQVGEDLIWIVDGKDPKNTKEETRVYRLRKGFVMPARFADDNPTRVVVQNKDVTTTTVTEKLNLFVPDLTPEKPSIEQVIADFFKGSKYLIDYERNLIVASGTREQLEVLERLIEEFDQPIQQVLIEARFITVSEPAFLRLGVAWETGRNLLNQEDVKAEDFTRLAPTSVALPISETFTNILGRENLSATLTALTQSGESQTLSAPRLLLVNNRPGKISDGKIQYYYEQYTVKQTSFERGTTSSLVPDGKPTKITSGVELDVVASIPGDGESIVLGLRPKVSQDVQLVTFATITDVDDSGRPVSTFEIKLPEARTQELSTRVIVKSGETVVMGGVLERNQTTFVESVPLLGNLPLVGALFRRRTEIDAPRYLLIFVTATIVSESGEFVLPRSPETVGSVP